MASTSLELTLYTRPAYVPKTITNFLNDISKIKNVSERLSELHDYIHKHEQELCKMEAFKRELPHCMLILKDAIGSLKEEAMKMKQSMKSESQRPVMDFLSLKRSSDEEQTAFLEKYCRQGKNLVGSSTQVWSPINSDKKQKTTITESETPCHFQLCKLSNPVTKSKAATKEGGEEDAERPCQSHLPPTIETPRTDQDHGGSKQLRQPIWKNSRRCWSPELHDRFMHVMEFLGGPEVATPKQIKELMQVDGLTNNQVKSHLQKYRLHNRTFPAIDANSDANPANQPVPFQGFWAPEDQYRGNWTLSTSHSHSHSDTPQGLPHITVTAGRASTTSADTMQNEDAKSEGYVWGGQFHKFGDPST